MDERVAQYLPPNSWLFCPTVQVAEESGLEIMDKMAGLSEAKDSVGATASTSRTAEAEDGLNKRLAALRN